MTLRDARRGLEGCGDDVVDAGGGLMALADVPPPGPMPRPRLLGPFDPLLHGWRDRTPSVGNSAGIVTTNGGSFRPSPSCGAGWWRPGAWPGTITLRPLERIPSTALASLHRDGADVLRFLGLPSRRLVVDDMGRDGVG